MVLLAFLVYLGQSWSVSDPGPKSYCSVCFFGPLLVPTVLGRVSRLQTHTEIGWGVNEVGLGRGRSFIAKASSDAQGWN